MGVAAGEEVERVGDDGEDHLERLDRAARRPGRVARSGRPRSCPHTARDSIPKPRPPSSLTRRIASTRPGASRSITARVPSGVRSRGPKPVPPVVTTRPAKPRGHRAQRVGDGSMPSAVTACSDDVVARPRSSRATSAAPGLVLAHALGDAVGDGEHLRRDSVTRRDELGARPRRGSPAAAAAGPARGRSRCPATRMSAPAAAASGAVSRLMPPSISSSTGSAALVDDRRARPAACRAPRG